MTLTDVNSPISPFGPWSCLGLPPGSITHPGQLERHADWLPAPVPGTVAAAVKSTTDVALDARDWWYRTTFARPECDACFLCCDGLATLCEIWLNGTLLQTTDNMFRSYRLDLAPHLQTDNELVLGFRSLTTALDQKRPRPRWKTALVQHQQLRWQRTTLLGRIPGWSPPLAPVGPWRPVRLDFGPVGNVSLKATLHDRAGLVTLHATLDAPVGRAVLRVGSWQTDAIMQGTTLHANLTIPDPPLWWPHTHGDQPLLPATLELAGQTIECGKVGFRTITLAQDAGFGLRVNGVPIFCRGACWTTSDMLTLVGSTEKLTHDLKLVRNAGANMLRVGGTMVYESDLFYRLCDELGILVWQDFMFANMDYPVDDPAFAVNIRTEATQQLTRLASHPSVAIYCGNSEVEQQAAFVGVPRDLWRNRWFGVDLPALCSELHPGVPYIPSTPSGGTMPFHVGDGVCHYYGVGAYLRSPQEVRRAKVKFTAECLAFANVPETETIEQLTGGATPVFHSPLWKSRVPRDSGAGWDFEDVRDHYLRDRFDVDPVELRSFDAPRYVQLSRVVSGELMAQVFAEWRGVHSDCRGGLVWFFKDLWPGAGWGIVDSQGLPKAAYYYLRRAWSPRQIAITDEGLDGLHVHVSNDSAEPLDGKIELILLQQPGTVIAQKTVGCLVASRGIGGSPVRQETQAEIATPTVRAGEPPTPRDRRCWSADDILEGFFDVNYVYRFGPPKHDVVIATLYGPAGEVLSEAFHFLRNVVPTMIEANLQHTLEPTADGYRVTLRSDRFLHAVSFHGKGYLPDDNYFHLPPNRVKQVLFTARSTPRAAFKIYVEALNLRTPVKLAAGERT